MTPQHPVTDHAAVRWLERIHGFALTERFPDEADRRRVEIGAQVLRLTVQEVKDLVCPPRLHAALRLGNGVVKAADRTLRVVDGRVVTCLEAGIRTRKAMPREARPVAA